MDEKGFLKELRGAAKKLRGRPFLDRDYRIRFRLGRHDKDLYDPIALVCAYKEQFYYPNETLKASRLIKVRRKLFDEINRASDRHPIRYDRRLRRKLMRAAGLWK